MFLTTCGVWLYSLSNSRNTIVFNMCPQANDKKISIINPEEMSGLHLVKPDLVKVRVLNATSKRNAAKNELNELKQLGFIPAANSIGNDTLYPTETLICPGQIRFGNKGKSAAATVEILFPCSQLLLDERTDTSVDLVMGSQFTLIPEDFTGQKIIAQLHEDSNNQITTGITDTIHCPVTLQNSTL